jgi:aminoglycoside 3-N-acetyltransferase
VAGGAVHALAAQGGARAPLATLERLGARILLLGAGFGSCTALHLAEYRVPGSPVTTHGAAVLTEDGGREWVTFEDLDLDEDDFERIGEHLLTTGLVTTGRVGEATAHLMPLAETVEAARAWMAEHRPGASSAAS